MAAQTVSAAVGILKNVFTSRRVQYLGYKDHPFLASVPKFTGFYGDFYKMPVWYGGNQGGSRTFTKAQSNKTGGLYDAFYLTRAKDYQLTSIELEAIEASESDVGAFMRLATSEVENTVRQAGSNLAVSLYRNNGGARGRVGSVSTTTLTLKNINDIVNFEKDMKVTSATTDGTSGSDDAEAIAITKVDRQLGTLTAAVTWTAGGHFANDSYLFREGDFGLSCSGLDAWLPSAAPGATTFFGVNRSVDTRLGGLRYDASAELIEEGLMTAESLVTREGGAPDICLMNPFDFNDFRKALGSRVEYDTLNSSSKEVPVSFRAIKLQGAKNDIKVVQDRNCPQSVAYMLQMDTWVFASLKQAPRILQNPAGGPTEFLWDTAADSIEVRCGYYGNLGCYAPSYNCRIALPTAA